MREPVKIKKKLFGEEARLKIKQGIDEVANYTKVTLGPKGRNIAFNQWGPLPTRVVNDGVTIANEMGDEDPFVNAGIEMIQEICRKTEQNAGDGTTQTALLTQAIVAEGQKRLISGVNPMEMKRELEDDLAGLLTKLKEFSYPVKTIDDMRNIAVIAGNNDTEIGGAIAEIMDKVGFNASIIIERGSGEKIETETVKGIYFDKGYRAPDFINNFQKGTAEYKAPNIFLVDSELRYDDEVNDFFIKCSNQKINNIVLIANEIEGEVLMSLAATNMDKYRLAQQRELKENVEILVIEAPYFGPDRKDVMQDIAIYTGATVVKDLANAEPNEIKGTCERIITDSKTTTIIGAGGKQEEIDKRITNIKNEIEQLDSAEKTIKEKLEKLRDTLASGVGIIYSGGRTEIEMKDRRLRLDDAVLASKSAVKEGYSAGGGKTYLVLSQHAKTEILQRALKEVTAQIARNAGKNADTIMETCMASKDAVTGYNARTDTFEDLIKAGVIDATLVLKSALQNAVSAATMFLTVEGIIVDTLADDKK